MANTSLDAQADALLQRSKRLAKRAREAKVKAAQAKVEHKIATEHLLGLVVVQALSSGRLGDPSAWISNLGLSQSDFERVRDLVSGIIPAFPLIPAPIVRNSDVTSD